MKNYEIIKQQLGGNKMAAMTGASFMYDGDNKLIVKLKSRMFNHIEIELNSMDLYNIRLVKLGTAKTYYAIKKEEKLNNIYAEDMVKILEEKTKMYFSL